MKRVHAAAQKLHNTMLSLDNHIHLWQECPEKNVATNLISLTPLPRLALAPFHNEVMKQQVWTARSAWVDKPARSAAIQWARAARIKCWSQKQPSYTVVTFRDSCLQPLNACLWKWQTTPRLQKQASEEIPVLSLHTINVAIKRFPQLGGKSLSTHKTHRLSRYAKNPKCEWHALFTAHECVQKISCHLSIVGARPLSDVVELHTHFRHTLSK